MTRGRQRDRVETRAELDARLAVDPVAARVAARYIDGAIPDGDRRKRRLGAISGPAVAGVPRRKNPPTPLPDRGVPSEIMDSPSTNERLHAGRAGLVAEGRVARGNRLLQLAEQTYNGPRNPFGGDDRECRTPGCDAQAGDHNLCRRCQNRVKKYGTTASFAQKLTDAQVTEARRMRAMFASWRQIAVRLHVTEGAAKKALYREDR